MSLTLHLVRLLHFSYAFFFLKLSGLAGGTLEIWQYLEP